MGWSCFLTVALAALGACASTAAARPTPPASGRRSSKLERSLSAYERTVLDEMNAVRRDPRAYAKRLVVLRRAYRGRTLHLPGKVPLITNEGVAAVDEAIRALQRARAAPALTLSAGMSRAARDHVRDIGPKGRTSHTGSDGSDTFARLSRHGRWLHVAAENIHYGAPTAQQVVMQLLIDDGVPSRGHRSNILEPKHRVTGVACGKHRRWRTVCVVTYAGGYVERGAR